MRSLAAALKRIAAALHPIDAAPGGPAERGAEFSGGWMDTPVARCVLDDRDRRGPGRAPV